MTIVCKKCGYTRRAYEDAPPTQCPNCGAIYTKVEAHLKKLEAHRKPELSGGNIGDENNVLVTPPASVQNAKKRGRATLKSPNTVLQPKPVSLSLNRLGWAWR